MVGQWVEKSVGDWRKFWAGGDELAVDSHPAAIVSMSAGGCEWRVFSPPGHRLSYSEGKAPTPEVAMKEAEKILRRQILRHQQGVFS